MCECVAAGDRTTNKTTAWRGSVSVFSASDASRVRSDVSTKDARIDTNNNTSRPTTSETEIQFKINQSSCFTVSRYASHRTPLCPRVFADNVRFDMLPFSRIYFLGDITRLVGYGQTFTRSETKNFHQNTFVGDGRTEDIVIHLEELKIHGSLCDE